MTSPPTSPDDVRHRLLTATEALVYAGGIHATGIDAIVKASGAARKSVYTHFGSKDQLVAAALSARHRRWMDGFIAGAEAAGPDTRDRLLAMFDVLRNGFATPEFHGCAFLNAAGELPHRDDPIRDIARLHKAELLAYVQSLVAALGVTSAPRLARQLLVLIDGAIGVALVGGDPDIALDARDAAACLLDSLAPPASTQEQP